MKVTVCTGSASIMLVADALETARLVASSFGYHLDLEPSGSGYTLVAEHFRSDARITANGKTVTAVAKKLIELLTNEVRGA